MEKKKFAIRTLKLGKKTYIVYRTSLANFDSYIYPF